MEREDGNLSGSYEKNPFHSLDSSCVKDNVICGLYTLFPKVGKLASVFYKAIFKLKTKGLPNVST